MMGFSGFGGGLELLPWFVMSLCTFAIGIPLTISLIRLLNETWFDRDS